MFTAERIDDLPDLDLLTSMSGLDFMSKMLAGELSAPPMARTLNYRLKEVRDGFVMFEGTPLFEHTNPMRTVHGGWYGTVLDSCMACAVMTKVPKGRFYTTLEYKVNITRAIPLDTQIAAIGQTDHAGRSTSVAHGEIRGIADDRLYATGTTTCLIMTP